jgi:hypothetical protein
MVVASIIMGLKSKILYAYIRVPEFISFTLKFKIRICVCTLSSLLFVVVRRRGGCGL